MAYRVILFVGFLLGFLLWSASVWAQPASLVGTTVQTTSTNTNSISVGCALGSSTCTGGIISGPIQASLIWLTNGYVQIDPSTPGSCTNRLVNNAGTLQWNCITVATGSSVSGTINTIPVYTAANAIGNSIMTQSGTTITVATNLNATTLTATNLGGTLTTASQPNITGVGTLTAGVWNAGVIGLAYGGTAANLSATGGASQFLRQSAVGGAVTVSRPVTGDLADSANICLLSINCAFGAGGSIQFTQNVSNPGAGSIYKNQFFGLTLQGETGSNSDFSVYTPTSTQILAVPTGTVNVNMNGLLNVGGFGQSAFSSGGAGQNAIVVVNTTAGTGNSAAVNIGNDLGTRGQIYVTSSTYTGLPADQLSINANAGGGMRIGSFSGIQYLTNNGVAHFYMGANGDLYLGGNINVNPFISVGTPTISGFGGGSITGFDSVMTIVTGATASTSGTVNFGEAWGHNPVCTIAGTAGLGTPTVSAVSTTAITLNFSSSGGQTIYLQCFGY